MSLFEKAVRLEDRGFRPMAMPLFLGAVKESPEHPDVWIRAASAAFKLGQPPLAVQLLEECLSRHPAHVGATSKLMVVRLKQAEFAAAAELCHRMLELDAENVQALVILGHLSFPLGTPDAARSWYAAAFEIERRRGSRRLVSIYARLICGEYADAAASIHPDEAVPDDWLRRAEPVWHGEEARDRAVCVHSFGGAGDVFLWARYVPLLAERVGRVLVTAPAILDRVLESVPGLAGVVRSSAGAGDALHIHALQLLPVFGTTVETVPATFPYLRAPAAGPELPERTRLRVGLVWAGNPGLWTDPDRSVPGAGLLAPLIAVPGVEWVSLQVGPREAWAEELAIPLRPEIGDFGDTARVLDQLDLLITVDTAVANLALALGVPTWVLPPTYPDFRWGIEGPASPWYPAARLFRRRHTGEWQGVVDRVAAALRAEVGRQGRRRSRVAHRGPDRWRPGREGSGPVVGSA